MKSKLKDYSDKQILLGNPYDSNNDLDGYFTQNVFYGEDLYFRSDHIDKLKINFKESIESKSAPSRIIYITGYAGNGKTSFINDFILTEDQYEHYLMNIDELHGSSNLQIDQKIKYLLRQHLLKDGRLKEALQVILDHISIYKHNLLISEYFSDTLKKNEKIDCDDFLGWGLSLELKDLFAIFYTILFSEIHMNKYTIIYFDNLDIIAMESVVDEFVRNINVSIDIGDVISRRVFAEKKIQFSSKIKFVFCVRDENEPLINSHMKSKLYPSVKAIRLSLPSEDFMNIIKKRIGFIKKLGYTGRDEEIISKKMDIIEIVLKNEKLFNNKILPSYNFDYRDTVNFLYDLSTEILLSKLDRKAVETGGVIIHFMIRRLMESNFMKDYQRIHLDNNEAYCYIDRIILTILINEGEYWRENVFHHEVKEYSFFDLIEDLIQITYYKKEAVLEAVARCFLYHKKDWVHLLTVTNHVVNDERTFMAEISSMTNDDLKKILLKINPAGFTYIRYLLPHFEFYSVFSHYNDNYLQKANTRSLYDDDFKFNLNGQYNFQDKIYRVFKMVELHCRAMGKFYEQYYSFIDNFYQSKYCFKHFGEGRMNRKSGYFHSTRIITQHIGYIDEFRIFAIRKPQLSQIYTDINEKLIKFIQEYINLLEIGLDVNAKDKFLASWKDSIQRIVESKYQDKETTINFQNKNAGH